MPGRRRAADDPPDDRAREVPNRRQGPKHATDAPPRKRAAPKKAARPASAPPAPPDRSQSAERARARRNAVLAGEANQLANRAALRTAGGAKPSTTARAVGGAAAGAAAGTAVGGPVGTVVGGTIGAVGGGVAGSSAKRQWKRDRRGAKSGAQRLVVVEFVVCMVIVALTTMTDEHREESPAVWMRRMSALMGVFLVLGLLSAAGQGAAKAAAGFGGLITVALLVSERNLFVQLAKVFGASGGAPAPGTGPPAGISLDADPGSAPSGRAR